MTAVAQVIDESVKNMSRNMVTKSDQEKVRSLSTPSKIFMIYDGLGWAG
jgi:hypothetical protein